MTDLQKLKQIIEERRDLKYPPNMFCDSETGVCTFGVQKDTYISMPEEKDFECFGIYNEVLEDINKLEQ